MAESPENCESQDEQQGEVRGLNRKCYGSPQQGRAVAAPIADADEVQSEEEGRQDDRRKDHFRELNREEPKGGEEDGDRRRIWACRIDVGQ